MGEQTTVESVVFVIDDDAAVRASLKSLFKSVGLNVELFSSADEFLKSQRPDSASCLVLDVRLPGISGLEFQTSAPSSAIDAALLLARPANTCFARWARMLNTSPFGARRTATGAKHAPYLLNS